MPYKGTKNYQRKQGGYLKVSELYEQIKNDHQEATKTNNLEKITEVAGRLELLLNDAPEDLAILFSYGTAKMQTGMNGLAINIFQKCLEIREMPEIWNNLGTAFKGENLSREAEQCWLKALELRPDADYYNNLSTLYINEGMPERGMEFADKGLEIDPAHNRLYWNKSLLLLEQGRWNEGFDLYDAGLLSGDRPNRLYHTDPEKVPLWSGEKGKVVVYGEQGMGDEIMFASCIPDLINDIGRENVIFDCHPRMVSLFERSFNVKCYGTRKSENINWPNDDPPDYRVPIGSLFRLYRPDGVFPKEPYLKPDLELVAHYIEKLSALVPGPYIGVGWRAGVKKTRTDLRSIKLREFVPLIEEGGTFVSLQYDDDATRKVEQFKKDTGHTITHWADVVEAGPYRNFTGYDYDHTIALLCALDLCILPNTSAVHACGALGQECWTLTPKQAAWRYQLEGDEMPMYGSWVRQFRNGMEEVVNEYRNRWPRAELTGAQGG